MRKLRQNLPRRLSFVVLWVLALAFLLPILYIILSSFRSEMELNMSPQRLLPLDWTLQNYQKILFESPNTPVIRWFFNSLFVSTLFMVLSVGISALAAYAYARMEFRGKNLLFWSLMMTMMIPGVVTIVPMYKMMVVFSWVDKPWALIVPGLSGAFTLFLIRQFMMGIPKDMDEAAVIDGAGSFTIFWRIILPMCRPVLIITALFAFKNSWNDFLWPLIVTNSVNSRTLTAGLQLAKGTYETVMSALNTVTVISAIPVFIIFLFAQKYFIQGISISAGIKG